MMIMAPEVFHFEYDYNLRLTEIFLFHYYQKLIENERFTYDSFYIFSCRHFGKKNCLINAI